MSEVIALMSMSLDGYVADPDDGVAEVFDWYVASGDVEITTGGSAPMTFRMSEPSAEYVHDLTSGLGALITGRRTFEVADGWGGNHAWGPAFVLTHEVPEGWPRPDSTVHFVTDGIESAVAQAKAAAGDRAVAVHGADTIQQLWNAGLARRDRRRRRRRPARLRRPALRPPHRNTREARQPDGHRRAPASPTCATRSSSRSSTSLVPVPLRR